MLFITALQILTINFDLKSCPDIQSLYSESGCCDDGRKQLSVPPLPPLASPPPIPPPYNLYDMSGDILLDRYGETAASLFRVLPDGSKIPVFVGFSYRNKDHLIAIDAKTPMKGLGSLTNPPNTTWWSEETMKYLRDITSDPSFTVTKITPPSCVGPNRFNIVGKLPTGHYLLQYYDTYGDGFQNNLIILQ